jgi:hypothetical protein
VQTRGIRTVRTIADELWRLRKVRERELTELAHMNNDDKAVRRSTTAFFTTAKKLVQNQFKVQAAPLSFRARAV